MERDQSIHFVQCINPECNLRFPLDLVQFKGGYCPRCGAQLSIGPARLAQSQPAPTLQGHGELSGLLDNIRSGANVGSIFRSSDGVGLQKLYLCGITPTPEQTPQLAKTALGAEKSMLWEYHANALTLVKQLKSQGFLILALEGTSDARPLFAYHAPAAQKSLLIAGNEPGGVDPDLLILADEVLALPMVGRKNSLNVAVAFGIAAYHLRFGS